MTMMCVFVFSLHQYISFFFRLDRFTSSSPHVALLLLLSQIYFFILLGPNALTVQPLRR